MSRPVTIILPREQSPEEAALPDLTAIGLAVGMGLYALTGAALAALSLARIYGVM